MTKYLINEVEVTEDVFDNELEDAIELTASDSFDDMLDDVYPPVMIFDIPFDLSNVLKKVDEVMYNEAYNDYEDSIRSDAKYELDHGRDFIADGRVFRIEEGE